MIGGYFDGHPWVVFDAPLVVEDAGFPGMQYPTASAISRKFGTGPTSKKCGSSK
jgi:hypothetical protein